jgi:hypothetical protein
LSDRNKYGCALHNLFEFERKMKNEEDSQCVRKSQSCFFQEKTLYKKNHILFVLSDLNNYESMSIKALHKLFEL